MKSGPALRQLASHQAIHDAAQAQAKEFTEITAALYHDGQAEECLKAAKELLKHWEEKIIAHADSEDNGLFSELLEEGNIEHKHIYMLMRDHDLFRQIAAHIKSLIEEQNKVTIETIHAFQTLVVLNNFHHRGEETYLFPDE